MNKNIAKYQDDSEIYECINSAYVDFQVLLNEVFQNLSYTGCQIDIEELFNIFVRYDWQDILEIVEDLNNNLLGSCNNLNSAIIDFLETNQVVQISDPRQNSYYKVWAGLISDES